MAKQIVFEYDGEEYTLEFNKRTVREMESKGFTAEEIGNKPMTYLPMLFEGAFQMHHRRIKESIVNEIYEVMTDKQELVMALVELYNEPLNNLMDEPSDESKNVKWKKIG